MFHAGHGIIRSRHKQKITTRTAQFDHSLPHGSASNVNVLLGRAHAGTPPAHEHSGPGLNRRLSIGHGLSVSGCPRAIILGIEPAKASKLGGEGFDVSAAFAAKCPLSLWRRIGGSGLLDRKRQWAEWIELEMVLDADHEINPIGGPCRKIGVARAAIQASSGIEATSLIGPSAAARPAQANVR